MAGGGRGGRRGGRRTCCAQGQQISTGSVGGRTRLGLVLSVQVAAQYRYHRCRRPADMSGQRPMRCEGRPDRCRGEEHTWAGGRRGAGADGTRARGRPRSVARGYPHRPGPGVTARRVRRSRGADPLPRPAQPGPPAPLPRHCRCCCPCVPAQGRLTSCTRAPAAPRPTTAPLPRCRPAQRHCYPRCRRGPKPEGCAAPPRHHRPLSSGPWHSPPHARA
jgi:hypothetical protein